MKKPKVRDVVDFDIHAFAQDPDLRKLPWVLRKFIKYRIMELRAARWKEKEIAAALGVTQRAVANARFKYLRYDRLYEDMRILN